MALDDRDLQEVPLRVGDGPPIQDERFHHEGFGDHLARHGADDADLNAYALRLLAEVDSWFSLGSIPAHNLLMELQFARRVIVLNLAYPGDRVQNMFRRMWDYYLLSSAAGFRAGHLQLLQCVFQRISERPTYITAR